MVWVNNAPTLVAPMPLKSPVIGLVPLPHTPLLILVSTTAIVALHASSFLPLAYHKRPVECLSLRGNLKHVSVFSVSANTAENEQVKSASFCVATDSNFVLVYQVLINHSNSRYEITDAANPDHVLQKSLPMLHENAERSLTSMFKSATKSLGLDADWTMINIEHFENGSYDDETRNGNIPLVQMSLARVLKLSSALLRYWTLPNSQNLLFYDAAHQIKIHLKDLAGRSVDLKKFDWFGGTVALEYNSTHDYFLHVNLEISVSVLRLTADDPVLFKRTVIAHLDTEPRKISFNPHYDLALIQLSNAISIYLLRMDSSKPTSMQRVTRNIAGTSNAFACAWSPCGEFFTVIDRTTHTFKMISKFGFVLFDSDAVRTEVSNSSLEAHACSSITDFCRVSVCTVASNCLVLYLINEQKTKLYSLGLVRQPASDLINLALNDLTYISFPLQKRASHFHRVPLLSVFQKKLSKMEFINGTRSEDQYEHPTGKFTVSRNAYNQVSLAYGSEIAISTPVSLGTEARHALWFLFQNHSAGRLNVVNHFWIKDLLVLINRFEKDDTERSGASPDHMVDELMILSTVSSKYGAGGLEFKFDSDLIAWRHTFNNRIISFELADTSEDSSLLNLLTSDLKIVIMEIRITHNESPDKPTEIRLGTSRISINVCHTVHLSSIRHKLSLFDVQKLITVDKRHFVFLLSTGDVFLLQNQTTNESSSANEIYEVKHIGSGIEKMQVFGIDLNDGPRLFVSFFVGNALMIYDLIQLVNEEAPNGTEMKQHGEVDFASATNEPDAAASMNALLRAIIIPTLLYLPLKIASSSTSIEVLNLEYQFVAENKHLVTKHRINRQLILNRFISHDLFVVGLEVSTIAEKYKNFANYNYCLELLLYENLNDIGIDEHLARVCDLVNRSKSAHAIYVNFLRKIEIHYWSRFFGLLKQTPVGLMDHLISLKDVELSYNYLIVYLNYKRESVNADGDAEPVTVLNEKERDVITQIIRMLLDLEMWAESYELCRFIKLLEPLNELLNRIQELLPKKE